MNYQETLDYLYTHLPMFQRIGAAAYKKDLGNTLALCAQLGNPQHKFNSIHVAGTNGKGSVTHMLAAICQAAGMKTGMYVSPHYKDFRERIRINGQYIPPKKVVEFVAKTQKTIEEIKPSFFELCVAMAFDHFAQEKVDIAIVEVGLGGRLDSTNVITPLASVITNISYDHMDLLGDTLAQIASEKAGIIKPGIPVIIGETHPESAPVFVQKARDTGAPIAFADQHFEAKLLAENVLQGQSTFQITKDGQTLQAPVLLDAAGPFQDKNLATVLQVFDSLPIVPASAVETGLAQLRKRTRFQGRWQILGQNPLILCDSAHNEAGLRTAFEKINSLQFERIHIVTGFANDKDLSKALPIFPKNARYYFAKANVPRGLDAQVLLDTAATYGLTGKAYRSVRNAFQAAKRAAHANDLVLVIGSIFVVAEIPLKRFSPHPASF
ncbi:MAG: bifunctional folylpolyglutamate synthase/dihydrofolate synthase [Bacteroidetes bacterium]|nr:bifunctional folylpolyglutamate synthase/dihydrofolate synthase [Bacteroidota bacterium]